METKSDGDNQIKKAIHMSLLCLQGTMIWWTQYIILAVKGK